MCFALFGCFSVGLVGFLVWWVLFVCLFLCGTLFGFFCPSFVRLVVFLRAPALGIREKLTGEFPPGTGSFFCRSRCNNVLHAFSYLLPVKPHKGALKDPQLNIAQVFQLSLYGQEPHL